MFNSIGNAIAIISASLGGLVLIFGFYRREENKIQAKNKEQDLAIANISGRLDEMGAASEEINELRSHVSKLEGEIFFMKTAMQELLRHNLGETKETLKQ